MSNAVAVTENTAERTIATISGEAGFWTSLKTETRTEKMAYLKAINNSTPLVDEAGKEIAIVDVTLQSVEIANQQTGLLEPNVRITLSLADGRTVHATSKGIAQSLKQAMNPNVLGTPDKWDEPLVVTVAEERGSNGFRYLTLKF